MIVYRLHTSRFHINLFMYVIRIHASHSPTASLSSRKVPVLGQFTMHMVEIIQLYTDQPHTWLGFRHHPSSSVFQPYVWLGYSLNDEIRRNEPHFLGHFKELHQNSVNSEMDHVHG